MLLISGYLTYSFEWVTRLLLVLTLLFTNKANCQTYKAVYECIYSSPLGNPDNPEMGFGIPIKIIYIVYANEKYVEIEGRLEEATTFPGADIGYKGSQDKAIIDLEKMLIYFPEEKLLKRIKAHQIDYSADSLLKRGYRVTSADTSVLVNFKKGLPYYITPGLFFAKIKQKWAIQNIRTHTMNVRLIDCVLSNDKRLEYKKLFDSLSGKQDSGIFDFLE